MFKALATALLLGFVVGCQGRPTSPDQAQSSDRQRAIGELREATAVISEMAIPKDQREKARCVVVVPSFYSGGFLLGARHGHGVVACRTETGWSAPGFVTVSGGSAGLQAGFESADVVMLVMSERGKEKLFRSSFELGAGMSAAAGPAGKDRQASTDQTMTAEIVSYARARGLFAGVELSGAAVRRDKAAESSLYGDSRDIQTILAGTVPNPNEAQPFVEELHRAF